MSPLQSIRNLIRWAVTTVPETILPVQQTMVRTGMYEGLCFTALPLGVSAGVPGGTLGIRVQVGADPDNTLFVPLTAQQRIKGLLPGDVVFHNPLIPGTQLALNADGRLALGNAAGEVIDIALNIVKDLQTATVNTLLGPQPLDAVTQVKLLAYQTQLEAMKGALK